MRCTTCYGNGGLGSSGLCPVCGRGYDRLGMRKARRKKRKPTQGPGTKGATNDE